MNAESGPPVEPLRAIEDYKAEGAAYSVLGQAAKEAGATYTGLDVIRAFLTGVAFAGVEIRPTRHTTGLKPFDVPAAWRDAA